MRLVKRLPLYSGDIEKEYRKDKQLREINSMRIELGLSPIVKTIRKCIGHNCDKIFVSYGNQNRSCGCIIDDGSFDI